MKSNYSSFKNKQICSSRKKYLYRHLDDISTTYIIIYVNQVENKLNLDCTLCFTSQKSLEFCCWSCCKKKYFITAKICSWRPRYCFKHNNLETKLMRMVSKMGLLYTIFFCSALERFHRIKKNHFIFCCVLIASN